MVATSPPPELHSALVPLLIGVVGKRDLSGHDAPVEDAIFEMLSDIRKEHPRSPIWVLTSAAQGADWCAVRATARLATQRRPEDADVRLVCPLPLPSRSLNPGSPGLLEEDFDADHAERLAQLLHERKVETVDGRVTLGNEELIAFELSPLEGADLEQMHRSPQGESLPQRTLHYEQCALFIADCSRLLITVMPENELPDRIGGTARTLHYKCTGQLPPSASFDKLIAPFEATLPYPALDRDQQRLRRISRELPDLDEPVEWLSPTKLGLACQIVPGSPARRLFFRGALQKEATPDQPERRTRVRASASEVLAPLRGYERYNKLAWEHSHRILFKEVDRFSQRLTASGVAVASEEHAALLRLYSIRRAVADIQAASKGLVERTVIQLGWLSVLSVAAFTLFKTTHSAATAIAYLAIVLVGAVIAARGRFGRLSETQADFRAAAEALRVQLWWRLAGIKDHVDRHYIAGAAKHLANVRDAVAAVNTTIALQHRAAAATPGIPNVSLARQDWVAEQIRFFMGRAIRRKRSSAGHLLVIVVAFAAGLGIIANLLAHTLHASTQPLNRMAISVTLISIVPFLLRFTPLLLQEDGKRSWLLRLMAWLNERLAGLRRRFRTVKRLSERDGVMWGISALLPITLGWWIATGAFALGALLALDERWIQDGLSFLTAILNGVVGMTVYRREKLAFEPEEHHYEEMAEVFTVADRQLAACAGDIYNEQRILMQVGRAALAENASWLRTHRGRPIEQAVGG